MVLQRSNTASHSNRLPQPGYLPVIGVVGAIGSGKSLVSKVMVGLGAYLIDADELGHDVLRLPDISEHIVARFGSAVLRDGHIDRKSLGAIVFQNAQALADLDAIVHPEMRRIAEGEIASVRAEASAPVIVIDAALLFQAGWSDLCDRVIFVDAPRQVRLERVIENRGWTERELARREASQWSEERNRALASDRVTNDGDARELVRQVESLWLKWMPESHQNFVLETTEKRPRLSVITSP